MTLSFKTEARHGYSVKFSPYFPQRLACVTCQYYGIAGCGTLFILDQTPQGLSVIKTFEWSDGLFDLAWAENNENILVTGAGDGSILVWDTVQPKGPVRAFKEHTKEVNSVDWSLTQNENLVLSGSWDNEIKLWDLHSSHSLNTYTGHAYIVYNVVWSPHIPGCFASASGDHTLRVWDARQGTFASTVIPAHEGEVLTCDWCKYDQNLLFSGSVNTSIRGWDLRNTRIPMCELKGHQYAVRRIRTSPFVKTMLASCSYDFTVRLWDFTKPNATEIISHHTEFVYGLDFNLHVPGQIADCSWDEFVKVYQTACTPVIS